jgi:hypothetical protein
VERSGARVATAGPTAESPSDVPPESLRDDISAVAIQKDNCIKTRLTLSAASREFRPQCDLRVRYSSSTNARSTIHQGNIWMVPVSPGSAMQGISGTFNVSVGK